MLQQALEETAVRLQARFDRLFATLPQSAVTDGMRYALQGGKGLRGFLVMETAKLHGLTPNQAVNAAAAIEALHTYSLVHDDLPCMDDDDLRRGRPTIHVKWDEATAVLVGDALQALAFDLLAQPDASPDPSVRSDLILSLAQAAGITGMVLGQAQDIAAESAGTPLGLDDIIELQRNKTGALIGWSAEAGARLAQADLAPMTAYAKALGLAFQIADDILDETGDEAKTGKHLHKDAAAGKATFVALLGLDGARARAISLVEQAEAALDPFGDRADRLRETARFVISRDH